METSIQLKISKVGLHTLNHHQKDQEVEMLLLESIWIKLQIRRVIKIAKIMLQMISAPRLLYHQQRKHRLLLKRTRIWVSDLMIYMMMINQNSLQYTPLMITPMN